MENKIIKRRILISLTTILIILALVFILYFVILIPPSEKYTHYGDGFGIEYDHELLDKYRSEIGELTIVEPFSADEDVVLETLEESLENGKSFYENAPEDIQENMEYYHRNIRLGVVY